MLENNVRITRQTSHQNISVQSDQSSFKKGYISYNIGHTDLFCGMQLEVGHTDNNQHIRVRFTWTCRFGPAIFNRRTTGDGTRMPGT